MACEGCPKNAYDPTMAAAARKQAAALAVAAGQQAATAAFEAHAHNQAAADSTRAAIAETMRQQADAKVISDALDAIEAKRLVDQVEADPELQASYAKWEKRQAANEKRQATVQAKRQAAAWERAGEARRAEMLAPFVASQMVTEGARQAVGLPTGVADGG